MRKAQNLPATAIQWGLLGDVGMITREGTRALDTSAKVGLFPVSLKDTIRSLSFVTSRRMGSAIVARVNWVKYVGEIPLVSAFVTKGTCTYMRNS